MKRKLLVVLLALACTLCCALGLTACDILEKLTCNHSWDDGVEISQPTCTEDGETRLTCTKCGMTKTQTVPALGHDMQDDECSRCGYVNGGEGETGGEQHEHTWSAWTVTTAATCEEAGAETRVCLTDSTHKETRDIAALDHSWGEWTQTKAPSCTEAGEEQRICANDITHKETRTVKVIKHNYENYVCTACGAIDPTAPASEGLEFTLSEDGTSYSVTGIGTCTDKDVVIPSTYDGKPVTSIGDYAFDGCHSLTSVTIPDSVTSIGDLAFQDCDSLKSVTIPDSVTSIGEGAFYNCSSLTSITIPDSVISIGYGAFCWCSSLTSVTIGNSVTSIGGRAFANCESLTSITIPDSVTAIGEDAFYGCRSLTSITIPDSVTAIGDEAFSWCNSLTSITVDNGNNSYCSIDGVLFNKAKTEILCYPAGRAGSYVIPDGVTSIGDWAFSYCYNLTSVTIGNGVTSIGDYAFYYCSNLTSITIGNSVTSIGQSAFSGCRSLTSVTFKGTTDQWNAIEKGYWWDNDAGNYTVYCTNGEIKK